MKAIDIVCWRTLFGDWEVTNAGNFFSPKECNPNQVMTLRREDGFITYEDCRAFIANVLKPIPEISIFNIN